MGQFGVLVQIAVTPGKLEELRQFFEEYYPTTQQEEGLEHGQVMIGEDNPTQVYVFELWRSKKDYEQHLTKEHTKLFGKNIQGTYYGEGGFIKTLTHFV